MLLQGSTVPGGTQAVTRVAGWSESVYSDYPLSSTIAQRFHALQMARAALLPPTAAIIGQRFQLVDPPGVSSTGTRLYPGMSGLPTGSPQKALYLRLRAESTLNNRPTYIRCIPDAIIVTGEYSPTPAFETNLNVYLNALRYFQFRAKDLAVGSAPIFSITNGGLVTTTENYPVVVGDFVKVSRTRTTLGVYVGGTHRVTDVDSATQFTIDPWLFGATTDGRVSLVDYVYPLIGLPLDTTPRAVMKKVGRPFAGFRGRASKRN